MRRTPRLARAIRSRPAITVLLLVVASLAVATSALGPLLVRAAAQSALADAIADADPGQTAVTVTLRLPQQTAYDEPRRLLAGPLGAADQGPDGDLWTAPRYVVSSTVNLDWTAGDRGASARMFAAETGCAGYALTAGRCPTANGEALLSSTTGVDPGTELRFRYDGVSTTRLTVVGTYDPVASLPGDLVRAGTVAGEIAAVTGDPVVLTPATLYTLDQPVAISASIVPRDGITVAEEPAARNTLAVIPEAAGRVQGATVFFASTLGPLLDRVDAQAAQGQVLISVTAVQAVAVAFFALGVVLQRLGRGRSAEWSVGRLRGIPRRRWWASMITEPALALVLGLPLGLGLAQLAAHASVAAALRPGTPVETLRTPVLLAAAAAFLAAVVALLAVVRGAVRRPLAELVASSTERRRLGPLGVLGHAVVLAGAAAALYQLLATDQLTTGGSQLGLVAPALLTLALALIAVRVAVVVVRRRTTRPSRGRLGLVVGRQLGRTPSALNPAVVVAAAVALAVFAGQVLALSERNQELLARAEVGAATVLSVTPPAGVDLRDAIAKADPDGRWAMVVQERANSSDSGVNRIVAVDSPRFDAVSSYDPAWSPVDVGTLRQGALDALAVTGTELRVTLADTTLTTRAGFNPYSLQRREGRFGLGPPLLSAYVEQSNGYQVVLGAPEDGTYRVSIDCAQGCRLAGFALQSNEAQAYDVSFTVTGISTDRQPASALAGALRAPRWTTRIAQVAQVPQFPESITAVPGADGLAVKASDELGSELLRVRPGDARDPMPTLLGPTVQPARAPADPALLVGAGLDGQQQLLAPIGRAVVLPRSLTDGVLVDLDDAAGLTDPSKAAVVDEVWLAADAPPTIERALTDAGVSITARQTVAGTAAALRREPITRGAAVAQVIGYAALALALLTVLAARLADAGRRRRGWRSLREAGLRRGSLVQLAAAEVGAPALVGVLVGAAVGVAATLLAAPRLPLVDTATAGPPLDFGLAAGSVLPVLGPAVVAVLAIAVLVALVETGRGRS